MLIGLEGVDGSGKSTLATAIVREIESRFPGDKVDLIHRSQLTRPPMAEYEHDVEDYRPATGRHLVLDRWHWGENVWGPLYRDGSKLTTAMFRHVELFFLSRGGRVWNVTQPLPRIVVRLQERGEDYLQNRDIGHVMREFTRISDTSAATAGTVIPPEGPLDELVDEILRRGTFYEEDAANLNEFASYIGRRTPFVLLVGEKRGGKPPYPTETAFLPVGANSGSFLLEALPDPFWKRVGICNALEDDVARLWDVLAEPRVVALGKAASTHLQKAGIPHAGVPHPQFVRRFKSGMRREYGELIAQVAETGEMKLSWPE